MSDLPMMPWWPKDFIAATRGWTIVERSLYRELLDAQWINGPLPEDEVELARIAGAEPTEFELAWPRVKQKFPVTDGGLLNAKLEEHRQSAIDYHEKRSSAGRAGGKASALARAEKRSKQSSNDRSTVVVAKSKHPSPSPSPNKDTTADSQNRPRGWPKNWTQEMEDDFMEFKATYPKRGGNQPWARARKAINARLREDHTWAQIIDGAIRYFWFCKATGKIGTEVVLQAATFCGPDTPFTQDWDVPNAPGLPLTLAAANRICTREAKARMTHETDDQFIDRMRPLA